MGHIIKTTALVLLPLVLSGYARAAEPTVITLSCDGTVTDTTTSAPIPTDIDHQPKPIEKMGVVVNLNERTVSFQGWVVPISIADAATINFNGEEIGTVGQIARKQGSTVKIDGILDRVTGHMTADMMTYETKKLSDPTSVIVRAHFDVLCKVTKPRVLRKYHYENASADTLKTCKYFARGVWKSSGGEFLPRHPPLRGFRQEVMCSYCCTVPVSSTRGLCRAAPTYVIGRILIPLTSDSDTLISSNDCDC